MTESGNANICLTIEAIKKKKKKQPQSGILELWKLTKTFNDLDRNPSLKKMAESL